MKNNKYKIYYQAIAATVFIFLLASRVVAADNQTPVALSLGDAVKAALDNNPMLAASRSDAAAAAARIGMAKSQTQPVLSTTSFLTDGDMPGILNGPASIMPSAINSYNPKRYYDQNLMLMYPIDVSRRLRKNTLGAARLGDAAAADYERARQDLVQQIRAMYYEVQFQDARADAYKAAVDVAVEQLKIDTASADAGKIPTYYLDRDKSELAMSEQALAEAQRDAGTARLQLAAMLGLDPSTPLQLTTPLDKPDATAAPPDQPSDKLPDIAAARSRAAAAIASLDSAHRASRPDISIVLMSDRTASQDNKTMNGTTAAIVAAFPLFDGGMRRAAAREASAMKASADNELKNTDLNIKVAYQTARLEYETSLKNIDTSEKALASAEENFRVAKIRYEAGKSILVEMLDAKAALTTVRVNRIQTIRDLLIARDKIARLSGEFANK